MAINLKSILIAVGEIPSAGTVATLVEGTMPAGVSRSQ